MKGLAMQQDARPADVPASTGDIEVPTNPMRALRMRLGERGHMLSLANTAKAMGCSTGAINMLDMGISQNVSPKMKALLAGLDVDPEQFEAEYLAYAEAERARARRKVLGR